MKRLVTRALPNLRLGLSYARLISEPISLADALAAIQTRQAARVSGFLDAVERAIFAYPGSPYRPLLDAAGYDFARIKTLVARDGLEATLRRLCHDGVYVSIEEFKGIREARRGSHTFRFHEQDFRNPLLQRGLPAQSGGTRSRPILTTISLENHRMGAQHLAVALSAYGLAGLPVIVWLPTQHGASLWAVLALAATGAVPPHWFTQLPDRLWWTTPQPIYHLAFRGWARLRGVALPRPMLIPYGEEARALPLITGRARHGCGVFTTPSTALRLALAARHARLPLLNVTFITIGEPLTPTKLAAIHAVGARAFSSLGFTEFGRATYGCAAPASADDTHICRDAVAVIQRRRVVDRMGSEVDALLFTSQWPDARRILLNLETGDYATLTVRRCGCALDALGWTEHLEEIRSFEKLNIEGRLFYGSQLISLVEETLPARFGGDPTDYQLVEREDPQGLTRLLVLVHPRLGAIDERALLACVGSAVGPTRWNEAGSLQMIRAAPVLTAAGKLMPVHHLGQDQDLSNNAPTTQGPAPETGGFPLTS